jgi:hypothetical protein
MQLTFFLHLIIKPKPEYMKKVFIVLLASAFISSAFAYPITPRPLRKLVMESELIVWVQ